MKEDRDYQKLASVARNIAADLIDVTERSKLLSLADEYEQEAQARAGSAEFERRRHKLSRPIKKL